MPLLLLILIVLFIYWLWNRRRLEGDAGADYRRVDDDALRYSGREPQTGEGTALDELAVPPLGFDAPDIDMPDVDFDALAVDPPDVDFDALDVDLPDVDFDAPDIAMPHVDFDAPDVDLPEADFDAPDVDMPDVDFDAPAVDLPEANFDAPDVGAADAADAGGAGGTDGSDDLNKIDGIGKSMTRVLNNAGIHSYRQLANSSPEALDQILVNAGLRRVADPESWPDQARRLMAEGQDELYAVTESAGAPTSLEEAQDSAPSEANVAAGTTPGAPDDLRKIEGIGPAIARLLNEAGIATFVQLAEAEVETLDAILVEANLRRIANPETWPEQAALAAAGRWDELQALQDELDGGRRR